eukprot:6577195-Pyramimonas_sp.AAC.1
MQGTCQFLISPSGDKCSRYIGLIAPSNAINTTVATRARGVRALSSYLVEVLRALLQNEKDELVKLLLVEVLIVVHIEIFQALQHKHPIWWVGPASMSGERPT